MKYVGIDLHKKSITVCVVDQARNKITTRQFACGAVDRVVDFFRGLGPFQAVVEATASYEWLLAAIEPLAQRVVLAHPGKLRVIAESTRKSDKLGARVLAEFLALDMIPKAYRPTPRQREDRALVRHRQFLQRGRTQLRNKVRRVVSDDNADRRDLFSAKGLEHLRGLPLSASDRFVVEQLLAQLAGLGSQLVALGQQLRAFAAAGPEAERRRRSLRSVTGVGEVTTVVVLAELGDVGRFAAAKQVVAYAGLAPGRRESAGKARDLGITKRGSGLLRWVLVEASWQLVRRSAYWRGVYARLKQRRGSRRAIVAVARRLLGVLVALLRSGQEYREPVPVPV
jgi:transposase